MTDQGKANYEGYHAAMPGASPVPFGELPYAERRRWDAGADAVELWLAEAPVDEDAPGNEPNLAQVAAERDRLRVLLDEIGVLAANAPEDDAFSVCEDIAMRIAAADVPDDGRHPDGCTCQFCQEDEREEAARLDREELDDDGRCPVCGMRHKYADDEL